MLTAKPITFKDANLFVKSLHRHHKPVAGCKFVVAAADKAGKVVGVAIVGRPVARALDDGSTLEVNRLCTDGSHNTCSFLYSKAARIAKELGFKRIFTYILESEPGTSLDAAGWVNEGVVRKSGKGWSSRAGRVEEHPETKKRYRKDLL